MLLSLAQNRPETSPIFNRISCQNHVCLVETFAGAQTILVFFPRHLFLFHRMSADLGFGDESSVLDHLNEAEQVAPKRKGGRTKETSNARCIPEFIRIELGYDTPPEETKDQCKIRLQNIRRYWAV